MLSLREALARKIELLYGHRYDPATEIVVTSGATEALFSTLTAQRWRCRAICKRGSLMFHTLTFTTSMDQPKLALMRVTGIAGATRRAAVRTSPEWSQ